MVVTQDEKCLFHEFWYYGILEYHGKIKVTKNNLSYRHSGGGRKRVMENGSWHRNYYFLTPKGDLVGHDTEYVRNVKDKYHRFNNYLLRVY